MRVITVLCTTICENAYIVYRDGSNECIVIDPGAYDPVERVLEMNRLHPTAVLLTHGHFDHIGGAKKIRDSFGSPVLIHRDDADKLSDNSKNLSAVSVPLRPLEPFRADRILSGGELLDYSGFEIEVLSTPGHSLGGVCFLFRSEKALFSGDTLFSGSFGRYDFADSSFADLKESILSSLFGLEGDYLVYPGHGDPTSLERERKSNPILFYSENIT